MAKDKISAMSLINRVDVATGKFQPWERKGSIVKSAQGNVFEFPVFISNSVTMDYATATSTLLEQLYAAYLQMAISINPVVDAKSVKNGLQFANFKTNTNKYLEYTDTFYQQNACHATYTVDNIISEFDMLAIEDSDAAIINEYTAYEPMDEFSHFFQEAPVSAGDMASIYYPFPDIVRMNGHNTVSWSSTDPDPDDPDNDPKAFNRIPALSDIRWMPVEQIRDELFNMHVSGADIEAAIHRLPATMKHYGFHGVSIDDVNSATSASDKDEMTKIANICENINSNETLQNDTGLMARINSVDARNPGFRNAMVNMVANNAIEHDWKTRRDEREQGTYNTNFGTHDSGITAGQNVDNQRIVNARNAYKATSRYYRTNEAIKSGSDTVKSVIDTINTGATAAKNVITLPDQIRQSKYKTAIDRDKAEHLDYDRRLKTNDSNAKMAAALKAPSYVDDGKCAKLNTMKPLLMNVTVNMVNADDTLQPINYIIGVKCHNRVVPSSVLPDVAKYPLKEMDKLSRKVKWKAGELKFLKDIVFRIDEKKQTAADSRDPNKKWYRRLYELAHMKGDAPAAAVVQGKSLFASFIRDKQGKSKMMHGMIPNCSIIMSQSDVDNIKRETNINLLKASEAKKLCGELFLISLVIIDTDAESIKILLPDMNDDFDVHSLAAVQKQLATLDTAGAKTKEMFKLLG